MANLFNLLQEAGKAIKNKATSLDKGHGLSFYKRILGEAEEPTDSVDFMTENAELTKGIDLTTPELKENMAGAEIPIADITVSQTPRIGGIIPDALAGYKENRTTPASLGNLGQNTLEGGRRKGLSYRLGEGLGSLARIGESPLGRGLLMGGLTIGLGGTPLEAVSYGATAGYANQKNRAQDRVYRNELIRMQQNALKNSNDWNKLSQEEQAQRFNDIENNMNSMHGYFDQNVFNNIVKAQQLKDNADYKKMYYDTQLETQKTNSDLQRQKLAQEQKQANDDMNYKYAVLRENARNNNLDYNIQLANIAQKAKDNDPASVYADVEQQLNNFTNSFEKVDNPIRYRAFGGASESLNTLTPNEANFNSQRTLLFNQIARKLGGEKGVLSDQDIQRIDAALPNLSDTKNQKEAKMKAVYDLLEIKKGKRLKADPLGIL